MMSRRCDMLPCPTGLMRSRDLERFGIDRREIAERVSDGRLRRIARGVYASATFEPTEKHSLAGAGLRVPSSVVCLLSALAFHGLTEQLPSDVWIAISPGARTPAVRELPMRVVRFSGRASTSGVEVHRIEGVRVRVFSVSKTVADLFKFRNKIGIDVAVDALRETLRSRRATIAELHRAATVCRVARVMRPYLEAMQ